MPLPRAPRHIHSLVPYVPGKPIEETQREFKLKRVIKLASNENPLGASPRALRALERHGLAELHRYPDAAAYHLRQALMNHLDIDPPQLMVGNGSNEVIDMLIRAYCVPGDAIVTSKAAFIAYRICAQIQGVGTLEAPLTEDLRSDLPAMLALVKRYERAKMVFIANPNNPTGTYNTASELRAFLRAISRVRKGSVLVVLDYAYWEYVTARDLPDPMALLREFPQVVVLRTFSKVYGLAGLRLGYGIADPEITENVEKVRQPFNINSLALMAGAEALLDEAFVKKSVKTNQAGMRFWEKKLQAMGIPYWPSQGNFLLCDVQGGLGKRGGDVFRNCLKRGVIFRPVANYGLMGALRISIGTSEENRIAAAALAAEIPAPARAIPKKRAR